MPFGILDNFANGLGDIGADAAKSMLNSSGQLWISAGDVVVRYCTTTPEGFSSSAWSTTAVLFQTFRSVGAALLVLFFLLGWYHDIEDVRGSFRLDNVLRMGIRLSVAEGLFNATWTIATSLLSYSGQLAAGLARNVSSAFDVSDTIDDAMAQATEPAAHMLTGILFLLLGLVGSVVIALFSAQLIMSVTKRFFKLYIAIPFGALAIPSIAGGDRYSSMAFGWMRTYTGYCFEIFVMMMALAIANELFGAGANLLAGTSGDSFIIVIGAMASIILPMSCAVAFCNQAETIVRQCLGF